MAGNERGLRPPTVLIQKIGFFIQVQTGPPTVAITINKQKLVSPNICGNTYTRFKLKDSFRQQGSAKCGLNSRRFFLQISQTVSSPDEITPKVE